MHVRFQQLQQRRDGRFRENADVLHAAQCGHELGALRGGEYGPARALPSRHLVAVHGHDEAVRFRGGRLQVPRVADVKEIETPVREGNGAARCAVLVHELNQTVT